MLKFKALLTAFLAVFSFGLAQVTGQVYDPVDWAFEITETSDQEFELKIHGNH